MVGPRSGYLGVRADGADRLFLAVSQIRVGKASSGTIKGNPEHMKGG